MRRLWRTTWLPATVAAAPLAWLVVRELSGFGHDTAVCCDWALLQIQTDRAGRFEASTGAYSRYAWHHPGPVAAYLAAPFHRLAGNDFAGLTVATAALHAAWAFVAVHLVRRRGGPAAGWATCAVLLAFTWGFGLNRLADPWNPLLTILATVAAGVALACAGDGARWALPVAALAGSIAVQAHVGAVPAVAAMAAAGSVAVAARVRHEARAWVPALVGTVVLLAVVWSPPVLEQVTSEPGNLGEILAFARAGHDGQSLGDAGEVVAVQLGLGVRDLGGYLIGGRILPPLTAARRMLVGVQVLLVVGTVVVAWCRGWRLARNLGVVAAAGGVGALIGATQVTGLLEPYLTASAIGVGVLAYLAVALGATEALRRWHRRPGRRVGVPGAQAAVVLGSTLLAVLVVHPQLGTEPWSRQISYDDLEAVDGRIERQLGSDDQVVYVDFLDEQWQPAAATVAELGSDGRTVLTPVRYDFMFGEAPTAAPPDVCIRYTADRTEVDRRPGARLLWMGDILGNGHLSTVLLVDGPACVRLARDGGHGPAAG